MRLLPLLLFAVVVTVRPAQAQLRVPGVGAIGGLPGIGRLDPGAIVRDRIDASGRVRRVVEPIAGVLPLHEIRRQTIDQLLRLHGEAIEVDPAGEPMLRGELLLISPSAAVLDAAQVQGFRLLRRSALDPLDLPTVVMQAPPGIATIDALARLRAIDRTLDADFNHVYTRSGVVDAAAAGSLPAARTVNSSNSNGVVSGKRAGGRVGLIDGGVDLQHPAFQGVDRRLWGCDGNPVPNPHGTAVASLLVGRASGFAGVAPAATLYSADVYCGRPGGGSVEVVVRALAWMASEGVAVVNVSLVGPPNKLLERSVAALVDRGHLIVAAVGNDGPSAPALYPAAYPDVVGVTGVSPDRRVLPEAAQGAQVVFAAPGADLAVADLAATRYVSARGTSFAAPFVAGLLSMALPVADRVTAREALRLLQQQAIDLGASGRDAVYGFGLLGERWRVEPRPLQALARRAP